MKVRTGNPAGLPDGTYYVVLTHQVSLLHIDTTQMAVHRNQSLAVIQQDGVAVEEIIARRHNFARRRGDDWLSFISGDIESAVRVSGLVIENSPQSEGA